MCYKAIVAFAYGVAADGFTPLNSAGQPDNTMWQTVAGANNLIIQPGTSSASPNYGRSYSLTGWQPMATQGPPGLKCVCVRTYGFIISFGLTGEIETSNHQSCPGVPDVVGWRRHRDDLGGTWVDGNVPGDHFRRVALRVQRQFHRDGDRDLDVHLSARRQPRVRDDAGQLFSDALALGDHRPGAVTTRPISPTRRTASRSRAAGPPTPIRSPVRSFILPS